MSSESDQSSKDRKDEISQFFQRVEKVVFKKLSTLVKQYAPLTYTYDKQWQFCDVCLTDASDENDFMMKCQVCKVNVHQSCYGVGWHSNDEDFICFRCAYLITYKKEWNQVKCVFCPEMKGIMKPLYPDYSKHWSHVICVNYLEHCWWENKLGFFVIEEGFQKTFKFKSNTPCQVCNSKYGVVISCDKPKCIFKAHVTCCRKVGVIKEYNHMKSQAEMQGYSAESYVLTVFCLNHLKDDLYQLNKTFEFFKKFKDGGDSHCTDPDNTELNKLINNGSYFDHYSEIFGRLMSNRKKILNSRNANNDPIANGQEEPFSEQIDFSPANLVQFSKDNMKQKKTKKQQKKEKQTKLQQKEILDQASSFDLLPFFLETPLTTPSAKLSEILPVVKAHFSSPKDCSAMLNIGLMAPHYLISTSKFENLFHEPVEKQSSSILVSLGQKDNQKPRQDFDLEMQIQILKNQQKELQITQTQKIVEQETPSLKIVQIDQNSPPIIEVPLPSIQLILEQHKISEEQQKLAADGNDLGKPGKINSLSLEDGEIGVESLKPLQQIQLDTPNQDSKIQKSILVNTKGISQSKEKNLSKQKVMFVEPEIKKKIKQNINQVYLIDSSQYDQKLKKLNSQLLQVYHFTKFKRVFRKYDEEESKWQLQPSPIFKNYEETNLVAQISILKRSEAFYERMNVKLP